MDLTTIEQRVHETTLVDRQQMLACGQSITNPWCAVVLERGWLARLLHVLLPGDNSCPWPSNRVLAQCLVLEQPPSRHRRTPSVGGTTARRLSSSRRSEDSTSKRNCQIVLLPPVSGSPNRVCPVLVAVPKRSCVSATRGRALESMHFVEKRVALVEFFVDESA